MIYLVTAARGGIAWGDVASWVSACVTLGAFSFAVVAVIVARRTLRLESERDKINSDARRQQDAFVRRAQSALVSAWWASEENGNRGSRSRSSWGAFLRNASDTPVYKANMTVVGAGRRAPRRALEFSVVPPTQVPVFHPVTVPSPAAGSGHSHGNGGLLSDYKVSLRFTDSGGVRWARDEYGALQELEPNLVIWASPEQAAVVTPFTADFLATYGVRATLDTRLIEAQLERRFIEADDGPDILVGPHDWVGSLAGHGLVEQITLSERRRNSFPPEYLSALSADGRLYAVPAALDTVALIRNTDLVPEEPESMEELIEIGRDLRDRGMVTEIMAVPVDLTGDAFHLWPLFTSAGGWLFERRDGSWDPGRHGIDTAETVTAFEKIRMLGELGILRPEVSRIGSFELFEARRTAFLLAASGAVVRARNAGVTLAVSPVPPFRDGAPGTPFLTVNGFYVASGGPNKIVASDLVPDYLTRADVCEAFGRLAHVIPIYADEECDPAIAAFHAVCSKAVLMPTFPQMREVWTLLNAAELALIAGADPQVVAGPIAEKLRALFIPA